jgi:hypothetical protein
MLPGSLRRRRTTVPQTSESQHNALYLPTYLPRYFWETYTSTAPLGVKRTIVVYTHRR